MRRFLEDNADTVAILASLALTAAIIAAYVYGVTDIAATFDTAINPSDSAGPSPSYSIPSAEKLDLKGLTPSR